MITTIPQNDTLKRIFQISFLTGKAFASLNAFSTVFPILLINLALINPLRKAKT